jgi:hypothetical protein
VISANKSYLSHLWFVMHHSDDPKRATMAVTCYLDESGTDRNNSQAVVAGLVMRQNQFHKLDYGWDIILERHNIDQPLHMKEFGIHGRHGHLRYLERLALFTDVADLINHNKICSVAATLRREQYDNINNIKFKKQIGVYGICFMLCDHTCFANAIYNKYYGEMAFILESGNHHANHIRKAHQGMMKMREANLVWVNAGSLTFAPKMLSALQAADVIAWGVRRQTLGKKFEHGFEPIATIFDEKKHIQLNWSDESLNNILKKWSDSII